MNHLPSNTSYVAPSNSGRAHATQPPMGNQFMFNNNWVLCAKLLVDVTLLHTEARLSQPDS